MGFLRATGIEKNETEDFVDTWIYTTRASSIVPVLTALTRPILHGRNWITRAINITICQSAMKNMLYIL